MATFSLAFGFLSVTQQANLLPIWVTFKNCVGRRTTNLQGCYTPEAFRNVRLCQQHFNSKTKLRVVFAISRHSINTATWKITVLLSFCCQVRKLSTLSVPLRLPLTLTMPS